MSGVYTEEDLAACKAFSESHSSLSLRLSLSREPEGIAIFVAGDLDTSNSSDFLKILTRLIPKAAMRGAMLVDLGSLRYISSTGVGALASLMTESEKSSIPFFLAAVHPRAQSIFEALGLWAYFRVIPSIAEDL